MWYLIFIIVLVAVAWEPVRKALKKRKNEVVSAAVVKPPIGRWTGELAPATAGTWGGANDEHDPAYTAQVLAGRPDWRGLGYCPGGSFNFEVHADGGITGAADIYGHVCHVQGRPVLSAGASDIEFTVLAHMVKLKFDGDAVSGLLWEGHDALKRANVVGRRV